MEDIADVVRRLAVPRDASCLGDGSRQAQFCYATNYLINVKHAVIVDVEASTAVRQAEVTAAKRMIDRVADGHGLWPRKLIADTGYGAAEMLAWLVHERGIELHVPVFDKSGRTDGSFDRAAFTFDRERDHYLCPAGKELKRFRRRRAADDEDALTPTASIAFAPASSTAIRARSRQSAVPAPKPGRSCARSPKALATWPRALSQVLDSSRGP